MIYFASYTNPELRNLYRKSRMIAKAASAGDTIMCPCGCLKTFNKHTKAQIFFNSGDTSHKDTYYNRVRSRSDYAFNDDMLKIRSVMSSYVDENYVPIRKQRKKLKQA